MAIFTFQAQLAFKPIRHVAHPFSSGAKFDANERVLCAFHIMNAQDSPGRGDVNVPVMKSLVDSMVVGQTYTFTVT